MMKVLNFTVDSDYDYDALTATGEYVGRVRLNGQEILKATGYSESSALEAAEDEFVQRLRHAIRSAAQA